MILVLLIAATAWLLSLLLPWWSVALPGLVFGGWLGQKGKTAFLAGFLGIGILWFIQSFYIYIANEGILAARIAEALQVTYPALVILATVIVGGLVGGFSALTGYLFKDAFFEKR